MLFIYGHTSWPVGSYFPNQGSNSWPLQGKHRDLTTGPPGKPLMQFLYMGLMRKGPDGLKSLDKRSKVLILQAASCVGRWMNVLPQVGVRSLLHPTPIPDLQEKSQPRSWKQARRHGPTHSCSLERGVPARFSGLLSLKINEGLLAQEAVHRGRLGPDQQRCQAVRTHTEQSPCEIPSITFADLEMCRHSRSFRAEQTLPGRSSFPRHIFRINCVCVCSVGSDTLWPPWTVAHQAALPMGFSRQEYWSGKIKRDLEISQISENIPLNLLWGASQTALVVTNLPASAGETGLLPESGRPLGAGNGNPLQASRWFAVWAYVC